MTTEMKKRNENYDFSFPKFVYAQVFKAYLVSGKKKVFSVHHLKAQTWYNVLNKLKKEKMIKDFAMGNTEKTAFDIIIKGFNEKKLWYENYVRAIEKSFLKEQKSQ